MRYEITDEYRGFIREMRLKNNISADTLKNALNKKSTATYNNIETKGLSNSLKNIDTDSIFKVFCALKRNTGFWASYQDVYEDRLAFSPEASEIISSFKERHSGNIGHQLWLIAFEMEYVYFDIPKPIKEIFRKYQDENNLDEKKFILKLKDNKQHIFSMDFKMNNTVEFKTDTEGNYQGWGINYGDIDKSLYVKNGEIASDVIGESLAEQFAGKSALPYHMLYSLLFLCFIDEIAKQDEKYAESKNCKVKIARKVTETLRENKIYVLADDFKGGNTMTVSPSPKIDKNVLKVAEVISKHIENTSNADEVFDKICINMENNSNFFELMGMGIFATLAHFSPDKMKELKKKITEDITNLL